MGLLDALLGRTKPVPANLDALFALPSAAITLEAAAGLRPTGVGSVCVKAAEGGDFVRAYDDARVLLALDEGASVTEQRDAFGYAWLTSRTTPDRLGDLVTALHGANSTFADAGFGPALLCSTVGFAGAAEGVSRRVALVYLYKRGTFYPFAPTGPQRRDTAFELALRASVEGDLKIEPDLQRWFPLWDAPGL
jgi:hypothetical protein